MIETSTVSVDQGMFRVGGRAILFGCQAVFPIFPQINVSMRNSTTLLSTETSDKRQCPPATRVELKIMIVSIYSSSSQRAPRSFVGIKLGKCRLLILSECDPSFVGGTRFTGGSIRFREIRALETLADERMWEHSGNTVET